MTNTATDAAEARAREVLAAEYEATAPAGKYVARDIRTGNLTPDNQRTIRAMIAFATAEAASGAGERGTGWVFWNPDSGEEYAPGHPVESGECCEAEHIRPSTPQEDTLWQAFQDQFVRAEAATAALASLPPATDPAIPNGWKLVPIEPTGEMVVAAMRALDDTDLAGPSVWSAMLAAAPTIPATGEAGQ